ncbi:cytochrome-c peroxidase [Moritella sp. 24]|uniref:cytochrome-c peroxidase n=1 Tax=Moritella sp. 24 TaxID=2746230 RepID=UPI001BABB1A4|nr:cytochrome c peroxidase [Moritella sp. 24]QUM75582.1 cytochrome-c peroxidase [Moritella sp. 24]
MRILLPLIFAVFITGCEDANELGSTPTQPYSDFFSALPNEPIYPANNPYSEDKEALGELLFFDPILSGEQDVACATCHHPDLGWADARPFSIGAGGVGLGPDRDDQNRGNITPIHSPTIMNVAFTGLGLETDMIGDDFVSGGYFWDLRADTLEQQAVGPIVNPIEMRGDALPEIEDDKEYLKAIVERLKDIPEYVDLFDAAFITLDPVTFAPIDSVTTDNLAKALATFQRRVITSDTRFDDFIRGDTNALTNNEITGLNKFINGGCARCHSGPMLSDNLIHETQPILIGLTAVRTPSLRNITKTAPYMHNGSSPSLRHAIAVYEDREDLQVNLEDEDFADIELFLRTLDTDNFYREIPESIPSSLTIAGEIH